MIVNKKMGKKLLAMLGSEDPRFKLNAIRLRKKNNGLAYLEATDVHVLTRIPAFEAEADHDGALIHPSAIKIACEQSTNSMSCTILVDSDFSKVMVGNEELVYTNRIGTFPNTDSIERDAFPGYGDDVFTISVGAKFLKKALDVLAEDALGDGKVTIVMRKVGNPDGSITVADDTLVVVAGTPWGREKSWAMSIIGTVAGEE